MPSAVCLCDQLRLAMISPSIVDCQSDTILFCIQTHYFLPPQLPLCAFSLAIVLLFTTLSSLLMHSSYSRSTPKLFYAQNLDSCLKLYVSENFSASRAAHPSNPCSLLSFLNIFSFLQHALISSIAAPLSHWLTFV